MNVKTTLQELEIRANENKSKSVMIDQVTLLSLIKALRDDREHVENEMYLKPLRNLEGFKQEINKGLGKTNDFEVLELVNLKDSSIDRETIFVLEYHKNNPFHKYKTRNIYRFLALYDGKRQPHSLGSSDFMDFKNHQEAKEDFKNTVYNKCWLTKTEYLLSGKSIYWEH